VAARRLPWIKLWCEALAHEKVALLSDGAFRTWISTLLVASEQRTRWRFASLRHAAVATGRPLDELDEVLYHGLLEEDADGAIWVHDWRQWQEKYPSDFTARSVNGPRTLREDSAKAASRARGDERREKREVRGETGASLRRGETGEERRPPQSPPQGGRGPTRPDPPVKGRRRRRDEIPADPSGYLTGEYGQLVAERMAAKLAEGER
jgi:hypothetical protein